MSIKAESSSDFNGKRRIESIREGNVWKKGPHGAPWKIRYLVLWSSKKIEYYSDDKMINHKGTIYLHELSQKDIKRSDKIKRKIGANYGFVIITKKRKWYFATPNDNNRDEWIFDIRDTIADNEEWRRKTINEAQNELNKNINKTVNNIVVHDSTTEEAKEMVPFHTYVKANADILTETPPEQKLLNQNPETPDDDGNNNDNDSDGYDPYTTLENLEREHYKQERERYHAEHDMDNDSIDDDDDDDISDNDYFDKTDVDTGGDTESLSDQSDSDTPDMKGIKNKNRKYNNSNNSDSNNGNLSVDVDSDESADTLSDQTDSDSGGDIIAKPVTFNVSSPKYVRKSQKRNIQELIDYGDDNEKTVKLYYDLSYYLEWKSDRDGRGMHIKRVKRNEYGKQLYIKYGIDGNDGWYISSINNESVTYKLVKYINLMMNDLQIERGYSVCFMRKDQQNNDEKMDDIKKYKKSHVQNSFTLTALALKHKQISADNAIPNNKSKNKSKHKNKMNIGKQTKQPKTFLNMKSKGYNIHSSYNKLPNIMDDNKTNDVKKHHNNSTMIGITSKQAKKKKINNKKPKTNNKISETIDFGNHKYKKVKFYYDINQYLYWETNIKGHGMYITQIKKNDYGREIYSKYGIDGVNNWYIDKINDSNIKQMSRKQIDMCILSIKPNEGYTVTFKRKIENDAIAVFKNNKSNGNKNKSKKKRKKPDNLAVNPSKSKKGKKASRKPNNKSRDTHKKKSNNSKKSNKNGATNGTKNGNKARKNKGTNGPKSPKTPKSPKSSKPVKSPKSPKSKKKNKQKKKQ